MPRMSQFSPAQLQGGEKPSTWVATGAVLEVEDGLSSGGIVQPYIGRIRDSRTGEVLFEQPYPNWARAFGGVHTMYAMMVDGYGGE